MVRFIMDFSLTGYRNLHKFFKNERFTFVANRMNRLLKFTSKCFFKRILAILIFFTITWKTSAQRIPPKDFDSLLTEKTDTANTQIATGAMNYHYLPRYFTIARQ